jgi:hypothetical protein
MADEQVPNDASAKSKAEGDRWESDSETVERYDRTVGSGERAGISNRPGDEVIEEQSHLTRRGEPSEGSHAGRGRDGVEDER